MQNMLLSTKTGAHLYHTYAKHLPIIDYHCHLSAQEIAQDVPFTDLGELWLKHDHYKWRAMRTFGIEERLITGDATNFEKFCAFAQIFPRLVGNPIYTWCRLELKRVFDIDEPLCAENARAIFEKTAHQISTEGLCPSKLFRLFSVEFIATTDDPADDLRYHGQIAQKYDAGVLATQVTPTFRPDKALNISAPNFAEYIGTLQNASQMEITNFITLLAALEQRLIWFKRHNCRISDISFAQLVYTPSTQAQQNSIVQKALRAQPLTATEVHQYQTAFLLEMAKLYHKHDVVMQMHIGPLRNANTRMFAAVGADTGFDSIDNDVSVRDVGILLDAAEFANALPKTIIYPLSSQQFEAFAVLSAAFCTNAIPARVILGVPWWFHDQPFGITQYLERTAPLYPVSLCVGMLTDSRSFLAYPRHEVFRRVFCDFLGKKMEGGEYPVDEKTAGEIVHLVCYQNAKTYLGL